MVKMRLRNFITIISITLLLCGCGYKFLGSSKTRVYICPVTNYSLQPLVDIYLANALRDVFIEYPEYQLVENSGDAEYTLNVNIKKWERDPLFFLGDKNREIVVSKFLIETEIVLSESGKVVFSDNAEESVSVSLGKTYDEESILADVSASLASKIYFLIVERK